MNFIGEARPLGPGDIADAASTLCVEEAAYRAVLIVETGGHRAFLADKRPPILFEAHIVHRLNGGKPVHRLSVPSWDRGLYASTTAGEYERLAAAIAHPDIGLEVALKATSWGLPQILGMNHRLAGYPSVEVFVQGMCRSAVAQLGAFNNFLMARGLVDSLRRHDWATFARGYNGTAYRANAYDVKLAAAYARALPGSADGVLASGDIGPDVADLQEALRAAGFQIGADGEFGRRTRNAIEQVQLARGWTPTGIVDALTAAALGLA